MRVPVSNNLEEKRALKAVQNAKNQREALRLAYAKVFEGQHGQLVLADLNMFCRGDCSTFHENRSISDMLDGRREVFLRINDHTTLSFDELWHKIGGPNVVEAPDG